MYIYIFKLVIQLITNNNYGYYAISMASLRSNISLSLILLKCKQQIIIIIIIYSLLGK